MPAEGGIAGVSLLDRLHACLGDILEGWNIRLADFQVDDMFSGGFQRLGFGQHEVGPFRGQGGYSICKIHRRDTFLS